MLVVNPDLPVRNVADLIKLAKDKPGSLSYASAGPGVPHHLFAELLKNMTGIEMTHVPYKGSLPALNDVIAGHVPLMFVDLGPALPLIQAGKVRAVGVSTAQRIAMLPDVPPVGDTVPGFGAASWQMIAAPAKTPRPIVDKLHADLKGVLDTPEVKEQIGKTGMVAMDSQSVAGLQQFITVGDRALGQGRAAGRYRRLAIAMRRTQFTLPPRSGGEGRRAKRAGVGGLSANSDAPHSRPLPTAARGRGARPGGVLCRLYALCRWR